MLRDFSLLLADRWLHVVIICLMPICPGSAFLVHYHEKDAYQKYQVWKTLKTNNKFWYLFLYHLFFHVSVPVSLFCISFKSIFSAVSPSDTAWYWYKLIQYQFLYLFLSVFSFQSCWGRLIIFTTKFCEYFEHPFCENIYNTLLIYHLSRHQICTYVRVDRWSSDDSFLLVWMKVCLQWHVHVFLIWMLRGMSETFR